MSKTAAELEAYLNTVAGESGVQLGTEPGFEFMTMLKNAGPSLRKNLGDIVTAITNPVETIQGAGSLGLGLASKAGIGGLSDFEPYADAMGEMIMDRYGSMDAFVNTLETDPAGVLMDFSGALGTTGKIAKAGGLTKTGETLSKVGNAIDPINVGANAVSGTIGAAIPASVPEGLYQSAMKPSTRMTPDQNRAQLRTAVEQGIMPNDSGVRKLNALIGQYGARIDRLIAQATDSGRSVDATVLFDDLAAMESKILEGGSIDRFGDLEEIAKVREKLAASLYGRKVTDIDADTPAKPLTASELQAIKRDAYSRADYITENKQTDLANQANQAVGSSARKAVESVSSPEVGRLNREFGKLLDLQQPLQRSANRIGNRNLISLPQVIGASAGSAGGAPGGLFGLALGSLITPQNQARAGIGVERMRQVSKNPVQSLMSPAPFRAPLRAGAYSGRMTEGLQRRGLLSR